MVLLSFMTVLHDRVFHLRKWYAEFKDQTGEPIFHRVSDFPLCPLSLYCPRQNLYWSHSTVLLWAFIVSRSKETKSNPTHHQTSRAKPPFTYPPSTSRHFLCRFLTGLFVSLFLSSSLVFTSVCSTPPTLMFVICGVSLIFVLGILLR